MIACTCPDPDWQTVVEARLRGFLTDQPPTWHLEIQVDGGPRTWEPADREPHASLEGDELEIRGGTFRATIDLTTRRGSVTGPRAAYPLDATLRILATAVDPDAVVLHAAGLAANGRGWACGGPSGCGKTTLAGLVGDRALCDEHVMVKRTAESTFRLLALPFWKGRGGTAHLAGVHLLRHGPSHQRDRLSASEAAHVLTGMVLWPSWSSARMEHTFTLVADLAVSVPVYHLAFARDPDVWHVLAGESRHG